MGGNKIIMSMGWGELARAQDEIARNEEQRQRERRNYHKLLYKYGDLK